MSIAPDSILVSFFVLCFGLVIGSFFNVLIYRVPAGRSIVRPPSACPRCGRRIRPWENIPVLSFLALRGRCAGCSCRIPLRYPLVEALTAGATLLLWHAIVLPGIYSARAPWQWIEPFAQAASLLVLIPLSFIDYDHYLLPDSFTLPGLAAAVLVAAIPEGRSLLDMLLGILAGGGSLWAVGAFGEYVLKKEEAMGGGDIKMMAFLGALWGWKAVLIAIVVASFLGSLIGGGMMLLRILNRERRIPFGPFLAAGMWCSALAGETLLQWYLGLTRSIVV